jgi:hypothetical protein
MHDLIGKPARISNDAHAHCGEVGEIVAVEESGRVVLFLEEHGHVREGKGVRGMVFALEDLELFDEGWELAAAKREQLGRDG